MSKMIPAAERLVKARKLIQKARDYPVPPELGASDINYIAQIKDYLREARDLVKFISYTPTATPEMKKEVEAILAEAEQTQRDLLRRL